MTRIVAGTAGGRQLRVPRTGTRPTASRVREAMFSKLEAWNAVRGAQVLDLFAGSGALGLEALSRGAAGATFVDAARAATRVVAENARALDLAAVATIRQQPAAQFLAALPADAVFELVFVDPPYAMAEGELAQTLAALAPHLTPDATLLVERQAGSPAPELPPELEILDERQWGSVAAWFIAPTALG